MEYESELSILSGTGTAALENVRESGGEGPGDGGEEIYWNKPRDEGIQLSGLEWRSWDCWRSISTACTACRPF